MGRSGTIDVAAVMAAAQQTAWEQERDRADAEAFRQRLWRRWLRYEETLVLREYWSSPDKRAVVERYQAVFDRIAANRREAARISAEERALVAAWKRTRKRMY